MKTKVLALSSAFMFLCGLNQQTNAEGLTGGIKVGLHSTVSGHGTRDDKIEDKQVELKSSLFNLGGGSSLWGGYEYNFSEDTSVEGRGGLGAKSISTGLSGKFKGDGDDEKKSSVKSSVSIIGIDAYVEGLVRQRIGEMGFGGFGISVGAVIPMFSKKAVSEAKIGDVKHGREGLSEDDKKKFDENVTKGIGYSAYIGGIFEYMDPSKSFSIGVSGAYHFTGLLSGNEGKEIKKSLFMKEEDKNNIFPINVGVTATINIAQMMQ